MVNKKSNERRVSYFFVIIPIILLFIGFFFAPDILTMEMQQILGIPLYISLLFLIFGFVLKDDVAAGKIKIAGWMLLGFYWSVQPKTLYFGEEGDIVNAVICGVGVFVLYYFAYHEYLSIIRNEKISCLNWIAGASAIAGIIYFGIDLTPLAPWLIRVVAFQSASLLNFFTGNITIEGVHIFYNGSYAVTIIFACTAVQSMVIFVGMILALNRKVVFRRKIMGLLVTIVPIYFLNLIRNALIVYLIGNKITDFSTAHNIIGKGGSLIALVILLLIVVRIVPEVFDEIICLTDLPKRRGPIEKLLGKK